MALRIKPSLTSYKSIPTIKAEVIYSISHAMAVVSIFISIFPAILLLEVANCDRIVVDSTRAFQKGALKTLNGIRELHKSVPLELDDGLTDCALKFAINLHQIAKANKTGIEPYFANPNHEGEAVYTHRKCKSPEKHTGDIAIMSWYCEIENHDFSSNMFTQETAQFSQLVWNNTKKLGLAKVTNLDSLDIAIVARFSPEGNLDYKESFEKNVAEPISFSLVRECPMINSHLD